MFHTTVKCVDCGALMVDVPSNTKRCAVCRVGHNRESVRKANKTRRAEEAVRPKPRSLDDDLEALNKYNEQRRAAGREPLTYGVWRSRGGPGGIRMNEFDSIRITEKGDTLSFEMTNELADSSHEAIFFLIRATSALIASVTKDDADPKEVTEAFGKAFSRHIAQDIQDERDRRAEETEKAKGGEKQ